MKGGPTIGFDKASKAKFEKKVNYYRILYPEQTFKAIVKIMFDIRLLAQRRLKDKSHIITNRLRSSIFVKTLKQKFANESTNSTDYTDNTGKSFSRDFDAKLSEHEGIVGTNVHYGKYVEKLDSFMAWAYNNVDMNKRFAEITKDTKTK